MRFEFIEQHCKEWPIAVMCRVLEVSRSGFYAWRDRPESARSRRQTELASEIKTIHQDRDLKNYGSPRMRDELVSRGYDVSENTVARLMRKHGLRATGSRKFRVTTDSKHSLPVAENVLNREFEQESADVCGCRTSRTSGPAKAGYTWRACWTLTPARSSAGR